MKEEIKKAIEEQSNALAELIDIDFDQDKLEKIKEYWSFFSIFTKGSLSKLWYLTLLLCILNSTTCISIMIPYVSKTYYEVIKNSNCDPNKIIDSSKNGTNIQNLSTKRQLKAKKP